MEHVHEAVQRNDVEELTRLLDEDPGLLEQPHGRRTPLYRACESGCLEAACLLLDRGAHIGGPGGAWDSPWLAACKAGHAEIVRLLLARGADPCRRHGLGQTGLIMASLGVEGPGKDHVEVIRLLLKDGRVPINARDQFASTALNHACSFDYNERVRVLLVEGAADHTLVNQLGHTPMAMARIMRHEACVRVLQWYEGELEKAFVLSKVRAVVDATESITRAPEKAEAKTEAEAQRAREEAAPAYLKERVRKGEALPEVEVVGQAKRREREDDSEEEECRAVIEFAVRLMKEDLYMEMMEGLTIRRWIPGEV